MLQFIFPQTLKKNVKETEGKNLKHTNHSINMKKKSLVKRGKIKITTNSKTI